MTPLHKHKVAVLIICFLIEAALCFFSAAHPDKSIKDKTLPAASTQTQSHYFVVEPKPRIPAKVLSAAGCNTINWANWSKFNGFSAVGTINNAGTQVDMLMTANYEFDSTPDIFKHSMFNGYAIPVPNTTSPRTTWSAGTGGKTTMCFSQKVSNPVLLLASLGEVNQSSTITFSLPYVVLFDGGGMQYNGNTSITGTEGYAIIMFPGDFTCVDINSSTPEYYTNIT